MIAEIKYDFRNFNFEFSNFMLKITTRGQYALLIMADLAESASEKYIPLKILSHRLNLSVKYLEQILIKLSKAGLVEGLRGNNGGYKLTRTADKYTVGEIMRVMEGDFSTRTVTNSAALKHIGNEKFWDDFDKVINDFVDSVTLEEIAKQNRDFSGFNYCI